MQDLIEMLYGEVTKKNELSKLSREIVNKSITEYLRNKKIVSQKNYSKKDIKLMVKEIRKELRESYSRFQLSSRKREKIFLSKDYPNLLKTHLSTREREEIYPDLINFLGKLNPKSIIDIACGLNPIALAKKEIRYRCVDINEDEIKILNDFFNSNNFDGKAICSDALKNLDIYEEEYDLCIIMKFLDFINNRNNATRFFLKKIKSNNFLVSFATKSISGKKMNSKRRLWFERIIAGQNMEFEMMEYDNEIFYLVHSTSKD